MAQQTWLAGYEQLKNNLEANEEIAFIYGVHPTQKVRDAWMDQEIYAQTNGH